MNQRNILCLIELQVFVLSILVFIFPVFSFIASGNLFVTTAFLISSSIVRMVFGQIIGSIVDRISYKGIQISISMLLLITTILGLAFIRIPGSYSLSILISFSIGCMGAICSSIVDIVIAKSPKDKTKSYISTQGFLNLCSSLLAPIIGGLSLAFDSYLYMFLLFLFLILIIISMITIFISQDLKNLFSSSTEKIDISVIKKKIIDGNVLIHSNHYLRKLNWITALSNFAFGIAFSWIAIYLVSIETPEEVIGFVMSISSLIGMVAVAIYKKNSDKFYSTVKFESGLTVLLSAFVILMFLANDNILLFILFFGLVSLVTTLANLVNRATWHRVIDDSEAGTIMSAKRAFSSSFGLIGVSIAPISIEAFRQNGLFLNSDGIQGVFLISGVLFLLIGIYFYFSDSSKKGVNISA